MAEMVRSFPTGERTDITPGRGGSGAEAQPGGVSAGGVISEAKDVASNVAGQAKELVSDQVTRRAERSANDISDVARALRQTKDQLGGNFAAPYVDRAADQLERLSRFMRTADANQMIRGVETFARREPLLFLGGAFALGMLGARFLKSSTRRGEQGWTGQRTREMGRGVDISDREFGTARGSSIEQAGGVPREYPSGGRDYTGTAEFGAESTSAGSTPDYGSQGGGTASYGGTAGGGASEIRSNTGPRGGGDIAGTGLPDIGATAPDPRGDYPPNSPPGGPYPGGGAGGNVDRQSRGQSS